MIARAALLTIVFALLGHEAWADEDACRTYIQPEVIVSPVLDEPTIDHTISIKELTRFHRAEHTQQTTDYLNKLQADETARTGGLTMFYPTFSITNGTINTHFMTRHDQYGRPVAARGQDDDSTCAQVTKIEISLSMKDSVVYVGSDFPLNSCSYNAVLEHEIKHVEIAVSFLKAFPSVAQSHIQDFLAREGIVRVDHDPTHTEAKNRITHDLQAYLDGFAKEVFAAYASTEQKLDTPEEYKRVSETCGGETQRIFNQTR